MTTSSRRQTLRKTERLHEKKAIDSLFENPATVINSPVRLLWKAYEGVSEPPVKVVFSVPRRSFKKAVDRNLLKRRMREAYRKNKYILYGAIEKGMKHYHLMFVYIARDKVSYAEIESKIVLTLQRLADKTSGK
jgi:ribonuclease P protein component